MRVIFHKKVPVFILGFAIGFSATFTFALIQYVFGSSSPCHLHAALQPWDNKEMLKADDIIENSNSNRVDIKYIKDVLIQSNNTLSFNLSKSFRYKKWMDSQNVSTAKLDMDNYLHGPTSDIKESKSKILESVWLKEKVHLTCVIFVEKVKLAEAIENTWGRRCNKLYYFARKTKDTHSFLSIVDFKIKFTSSWQYLCEVINYIWNTAENKKTTMLEWVIFVKDDTVIIPENLRFLIAPLNFSMPYYLGHAITFWGHAYNVAQAGYVLSKGSVQKIIGRFNSSETCALSGKYWKMEDYYLGKHLASLDIYPSDTRDSNLRGIFHGYSLQTMLWGNAKFSNYWTKALYALDLADCCSPISVTFNACEADKMYTLNYMLYYLHIHTRLGIYGNRPAPTPVPEEEVWKSVLQEEFGIINVTEMSKEKYYQIWRSRYSEPEEFIAHNFNTMPSTFIGNTSKTLALKHPSMK